MSTNESKDTNNNRRQFLGAAVATAAVTLAPGVKVIGLAQAKPLDQPVSDKNRWGLLIDSNKCSSGCSSCVDACATENGIEKIHGPETDPQWIRKVTVRHKESGKESSLPLMCQHCENPPCVDVCPTGASFRREDGIVLVDRHTCIGCRYCMMACPYKARSFVHEELTNQVEYVPRGKGCVESCTLCVQRIDEVNGPRDPACVEACAGENHNAIIFGDLNDKYSDISQEMRSYQTRQLRADLDLNTGVRYRGV
ncbi:MAG TPA: 4Fe-4S dicluster domain-containing protein [Gammaproteobacteria bacterium]|nr:4Fe-4S dicluster domain-containing protein [Gammaproteobacteria bacterium]